MFDIAEFLKHTVQHFYYYSLLFSSKSSNISDMASSDVYTKSMLILCKHFVDKIQAQFKGTRSEGQCIRQTI